MTVAEMAKKLGITPAAIYRAVRVQRARAQDPLLPLYDLAKRNDISENMATLVITEFRLGGLPALRAMPKRYNYETTAKGRLAFLILNATDPDVKKAIAANEKLRKK